MKFELWKDDEGYVLFPSDADSNQRKLNLGPAAHLVTEIEADSIEEADEEKRKLLGFEPSSPMLPHRYRVTIFTASGHVVSYHVTTYLSSLKAVALAAQEHERRHPFPAGPNQLNHVTVIDLGPQSTGQSGESFAPDDIRDPSEGLRKR